MSDNDNITRKRSRTAVKVAVALALLLIASLAGGYYMMRDSSTAKLGLREANNKVSEQQKTITDLKIELDTTRRSLAREKHLREKAELINDTLRTMFPLYVTSMEIANADGHGSVITPYGKQIMASGSMYLMPRITYWGLRGGEPVELKVRLYGPDGLCVTGSGSPEGYSYAYKINPVYPGENTIQLSGWGGPDKGHFVPGTYRYEVWLEDMCLKEKIFTLK